MVTQEMRKAGTFVPAFCRSGHRPCEFGKLHKLKTDIYAIC